MSEPFEIILSDNKPSSSISGYEPSESDPVIDTPLASRFQIFRGNGRGYGSGPGYVTIPVDFRTKLGHQIRLEWYKDGRKIKSNSSMQWSGRTSIRIHAYDRRIEGQYTLCIIDETSGRSTPTQGSVVLA